MRLSTTGGGGIIGRLVFSAFGLFFAFMGSMFVKQEWSALQDTKAMQQWSQTVCTVVSSEMEDAGEDYQLTIRYSYEVNGNRYTADRYGKQQFFTAGSVSDIEKMRQKYAEQKTVNCHYNPEKPTEAVLELPTVASAYRTLGFTLIFPGVGLLFAFVPWLATRRGGSQEAAGNNMAGKKTGKRGLIFFGSIFAGAGLLMFYPLFIRPMMLSSAAKSWDSVPATVVSSKVKSHSDDDGTTYSVYIAYRYSVNGEEFLGDRYNFMGGSSSGYDGKAAVVRQYPKEHQFEVFVNPVDPSDSVINREIGAEKFIGLFPLIFFAVGIAIIIGGLRTAKKRKLDDAQSREHIVVLKGTSPVAKAVGIVIFTIIWNGIVFFIFKSDAPVFFHIIFGLAGLAMIAASVHSILAIFNPQPTVEISPGNIRPGTGVALSWRMRGNSDRIDRLTITLRCQRITTETRRSGGETKTSVVKTPIFTQELHRADGALEISQSSISFSVPENQPASMPGNDGGIQWHLLFHGDIPRWPDLKIELPFTVYPGEQET